jgi:hypothetical protein
VRNVDKALRRKVAKRKVRLKQVIVGELGEAGGGAKKRADFSDLVGKWTPDPGFDEIIAAGRKIDRDKWKLGRVSRSKNPAIDMRSCLR